MINNRATWHGGKVCSADRWPIPAASVIGKKVQAGAEEEYQHHDSKPEEVLKLLKPMAVNVSLSEKSLLDMDYWPVSEDQRKTKTMQAFNGLIWWLCPRQGFQCQLWGVWDVFSLGISPFKHNTLNYVCVLEELALWGLALHCPAFEGGWCKQERKFRLSATDSQKGRIKVLREKRKGFEKKQMAPWLGERGSFL